MKLFWKVFTEPSPVRELMIRAIRRIRLGSYEFRLSVGATERPQYGYIVYNAALLAKKLKLTRISVLEFGVAGGQGLLNLEFHAREIERLLAVKIDIYGFDTGEGLPEPVDYRDLPYHWKGGFFRMDVALLRSKLTVAKLVLGNIATTAAAFFHDHDPAPIGAVIQDFDFYSSTASALKMFDFDRKFFLPRIHCYFDDTIGNESSMYNDFTGQRLAIKEFNQTHEYQKLAVPYHLLGRKRVEPWYHQIFIYHDFQHHQYNEFISEENQQLPI